MSLAKEFREFISRGNVIDLAIGVIIGGAFGQIVTSLVNDVIMPPIEVLLGNVKLVDIKMVLRPEALDAKGQIMVAEIALRIGNFVQVSLNFIIIAFAIFAMVKVVNRIKREFEHEQKQQAKIEKKVEPSQEILLLREIRDLLRGSR